MLGIESFKLQIPLRNCQRNEEEKNSFIYPYGANTYNVYYFPLLTRKKLIWVIKNWWYDSKKNSIDIIMVTSRPSLADLHHHLYYTYLAAHIGIPFSQFLHNAYIFHLIQIVGRVCARSSVVHITVTCSAFRDRCQGGSTYLSHKTETQCEKLE